MPIYTYEIITDDVDENGEPIPGMRFEVMQKMSDEPLTKHPELGMPCRRVMTPPNLAFNYTDAHDKARMTDDRIARSGLTKYVKTETGHYEKAAGDGPKHISADDV